MSKKIRGIRHQPAVQATIQELSEQGKTVSAIRQVLRSRYGSAPRWQDLQEDVRRYKGKEKQKGDFTPTKYKAAVQYLYIELKDWQAAGDNQEHQLKISRNIKKLNIDELQSVILTWKEGVGTKYLQLTFLVGQKLGLENHRQLRLEVEGESIYHAGIYRVSARREILEIIATILQQHGGSLSREWQAGLRNVSRTTRNQVFQTMVKTITKES